MIKSIRYFLLISLLLSITIASAINGIGNYLLDEQVIQPYLDSQLVRLSIPDQTYLSESTNHNFQSQVRYLRLPEKKPTHYQPKVFVSGLEINGHVIINLNLK